MEEENSLVTLLSELMHQQRLRPSQLAAEIGVSHSNISRWLHGRDTPSLQSCYKLAKYSGIPLRKILSLSGHVPAIAEPPVDSWPEFREYATKKYPDELDDDLITMIETLIQQRRRRLYGSRDS